jgi:glycosyltransferase involved in cell wall biosynthesis
MMESMAGGLPCIASKIRCNVDLIENGINGVLCSPTSSDEFAEAIVKLISDKDLMNKMRNANLEKIKQYDVSVVAKEIEAIYKEVLG